MKRIIILLTFILILSSCSIFDGKVKNESGFTVKNLMLIDELTGTKDIPNKQNGIAFKTNYHIWLYEVTTDIEHEKKYLLALELSIIPEEYDLASVVFEVQLPVDERNLEMELCNELIHYDLKDNFYTLRYNENGHEMNSRVNVKKDFFDLIASIESSNRALIMYDYDGGKILFEYSDYSKYESMQKGLLTFSSLEAITNIEDVLDIVFSLSATNEVTFHIEYDVIKDEIYYH